MAKWLDKLKSCFGVKPGEVIVATAGINVGKTADTPEMAFVKEFQPKVGQLMLSSFEVRDLLRDCGARFLAHSYDLQVWNHTTGRLQKVRSTPFVAITGLGSQHARIRLYGYCLTVPRSDLQFK